MTAPSVAWNKKTSVTNINAKDVKPGFAKNLRSNADLLFGLYYLVCYYCGNKYMTPIEFDMELHLYERHRKEVYQNSPLNGPGSSFDARVDYLLKIMRRKARLHKQFMTEECFEWS
jgi:hypothetical protein